MRRWVRRLVRAFLWVSAVLLVPCIGLFFYLRGDKTQVFAQVAGDFQAGRVLESESLEGVTIRRVAMENHRGERVAELFIRRPLALTEDYKILLTYAGLKTRGGILDLIPQRDDLVLVAIQYPYESPKTLAAKLGWPGYLRRTVFRTVAGGMLATRFLEQQEGLDLQRLTVMGASLGSPFAVMHGALDERVPRVLVIHGGGDLPRVLRYYHANRGRAFEGQAQALLAEGLVAAFEPLRYVDRIAPRELIIIAAENDRYFPRESALALYEKAGEPKQLTWTDSGHVRSRNEALIGEIILQVERYLDEGAASP